MKKIGQLAALLTITLAGCVSTMMEGYVGKPIEEAQLEFGPPIQVLAMSDGRRAYQFRYGGGSFVTPGHANTTVTGYGNMAVINTTATPAMIVESSGCVLTFFTVKEGEAWIVRDMRVPGGLVC